MNIVWFIFSCVLISHQTFASPEARLECPIAELHELSEDCPWAAVARAVGASDGKKLGPLLETLSATNPPLRMILKHIGQDAKRTSWKTLWGTSNNFDEFAGAIIVFPPLVKALAGWFGVKFDPKETVVHAGLEHTYGYLFSVLQTPFGYKRTRWVSRELPDAFGLPPDILGPTPNSGTLFSNVTYFLGRIAFDSASSSMKKLRSKGQSVPKELQSYSYASLSVSRLDEILQLGDRDIVLHTDFVKFPKGVSSKGNGYLAVYSVSDSKEGHEQLITGFIVPETFKEKVVAVNDLGDLKPITTRYNAIVKGVTGVKPPPTGRRALISSRVLR